MRRRTVHTNTVERVRRAIQQQYFLPGMRLSDPDLAAQLGVSHSTVREALRQLTHEGLVISVPHRGFFVAGFTINDMIDLLEIRGLLEGRIAASIAPNLTNDDFTALEQLARAIHYQPGGQQSAFWKADLAFHQYLVQRCPKLILTELWSALSSRLAMLELLFHEAFETGLIDSQEYHLVYCDELRAGEPEQARQAAEDHYARPVNHLKQAIVQKEELAMR